jgi:hypothetical protein
LLKALACPWILSESSSWITEKERTPLLLGLLARVTLYGGSEPKSVVNLFLLGVEPRSSFGAEVAGSSAM